MRPIRNYLLATLVFSILFLLISNKINAQQDVSKDTVANLFDMGKMWTFDYPPSDYFKKTMALMPMKNGLKRPDYLLYVLPIIVQPLLFHPMVWS